MVSQDMVFGSIEHTKHEIVHIRIRTTSWLLFLESGVMIISLLYLYKPSFYLSFLKEIDWAWCCVLAGHGFFAFFCAWLMAEFSFSERACLFGAWQLGDGEWCG